MYLYGFELEGFAINPVTNTITIPPRRWPADGFPGLLEIRTNGGKSIKKAYGALLAELFDLNIKEYLPDFKTHEHRFSGRELASLRKDRDFDKDNMDVQNLYGKEPRVLNGKTLASFQINISYQISKEWKEKEVLHPARYGVLDVHKIVRNLDKEFSKEIKASNRQPGVYCIKDEIRLEYRSLPNFVFESDPYSIMGLINRIETAVEG